MKHFGVVDENAEGILRYEHIHKNHNGGCRLHYEVVRYSCFIQAVRKRANQPQAMLNVHDFALSVRRQIRHVHGRSANDGNRPKLVAENLEKSIDI